MQGTVLDMEGREIGTTAPSPEDLVVYHHPHHHCYHHHHLLLHLRKLQNTCVCVVPYCNAGTYYSVNNHANVYVVYYLVESGAKPWSVPLQCLGIPPSTMMARGSWHSCQAGRKLRGWLG